jgi:glycerol-3-phosphate acyltransferase PlsY
VVEDWSLVCLAYLGGSIPFGLLLSRCWGPGRLRETGSGNIGATNVLRTQGIPLGILTFLLDFLKGFLACKYLPCSTELALCGLIAAPVLGHIFPLWLRGRGGKGVATYFGVLGALSMPALIGSLLVWGVVFGITRISAVASLTAMLLSCVFFYHLPSCSCNFINQLYVLMALVLIIVLRHHDNLKRLLGGKESNL